MIARGVDMFDCVMPTRVARHGMAFTLDGPIQIKNKVHERDERRACVKIFPLPMSPPSPEPISGRCCSDSIVFPY
ncbi:MAG: hypothetical protein QM755_19465 [Luteolibacter sp.]